jgi:hypothetical protein
MTEERASLASGKITCKADLVALAARMGIFQKDLIAMSAETDPYLADREGRREWAEWFADQYERLGIEHGAHLRRIHYRLISQPEPVIMPNGEAYVNTLDCFDKLGAACRDARYLGLIPRGQMSDQRNPKPVLNFTPTEADDGDIEIGDGSVTSGEYRYSGANYTLPDVTVTEPTIPQRYHMEVWVEKSTVNDIVIPICQTFRVNVQIGVGEFSATRCEQLVDRVIESAEHGHPVRIFYISDFDPSGQDMPVSVSRKVEFDIRERDDLDIELFPIALTHEQCIQYQLPRTPLKERTGAPRNLNRHSARAQPSLTRSKRSTPASFAVSSEMRSAGTTTATSAP